MLKPLNSGLLLDVVKSFPPCDSGSKKADEFLDRSLQATSVITLEALFDATTLTQYIEGTREERLEIVASVSTHCPERGGETQMTIKERKLNDVTILELDGKLTQEENVVLRTRSTAAIQGGARKLILNLALVQYIDGNGVGALAACYITLRKMNGRLALLNINDHLRQVLTLTKLSSVFETFDSESAALESYSAIEGPSSS